MYTQRKQHVRAVQRTFVSLTALTDFITGLVMPVTVLNLRARDVPVGTITGILAMAAIVTGLLELPTGGLGDALGRRRVLLVASVIACGGFTLLAFSSTTVLLVLATLVLATATALARGPLEAWFVDASARLGEYDPLPGLSRAASWSNVTTGLGSIVAAVLPLAFVALPEHGDGLFVRVTPIYVTVIACHLLRLALIERHVNEPAPATRTSVRGVLGEAARTLARTVRLGRVDQRVRRVIAAGLAAGFAVGVLEVVTPLALDDLQRSSSPTLVFGIASAIGFGGAALTAAVAPRLVAVLPRWCPPLPAVLVAVSVVSAACLIAPRPWGVVAAFVAMWVVGGPLSPVINDELHRNVTSAERTTALSMLMVSLTVGLTAGDLAVGLLDRHVTRGGIVLLGLEPMLVVGLWQLIRPLGMGRATDRAVARRGGA